MPNYEYECDCGNKFEKVKPIKDRHTGVCTCGKPAKLLISPWGSVTFAGVFSVVSHDGTVLSRKQSTQWTPMEPEPIHGGKW